jgi:hypothetical protein
VGKRDPGGATRYGNGVRSSLASGSSVRTPQDCVLWILADHGPAAGTTWQ